MDDNKDYYATLKIQQGRLKYAMQVLGIKTVSNLSRRCGVTESYIGQILNFKLSPRMKNGKWRDATLKICNVLGCNPSELFPEHLDYEVTTNQIYSFVEHAQLSGREALQLSPSDELHQSEMECTVAEMLGTVLTEREQIVIKSLYWEKKTLAEIGLELNTTSERVRQIHEKCLLKLRHPKRLNKLIGVSSFNGR